MEFTFNINENNALSLIATNVDCAGPIIELCTTKDSWVEYYLPMQNYGNKIKEEELIKWVNFISSTGLTILYCGVIYRKDLEENYYLLIIRNDLLSKNFKNIKGETLYKLGYLNLMAVQALRFIEYYPEIVDYSYEIYEELKDYFMSLTLAQVKYFFINDELNNFSHTYTWLYIYYPFACISQKRFNNIISLTTINNIFNRKYMNLIDIKYVYDDETFKKYYLNINTTNSNLYNFKVTKKIPLRLLERKQYKKFIEYTNKYKYKLYE